MFVFGRCTLSLDAFHISLRCVDPGGRDLQSKEPQYASGAQGGEQIQGRRPRRLGRRRRWTGRHEAAAREPVHQEAPHAGGSGEPVDTGLGAAAPDDGLRGDDRRLEPLRRLRHVAATKPPAPAATTAARHAAPASERLATPDAAFGWARNATVIGNAPEADAHVLG